MIPRDQFTLWMRPKSKSKFSRNVGEGYDFCGMTKADFLARAEELHEQRSSCDIDHVCSTCFRVFRNWQDKDRHERVIHTNDTSVQFKCSLWKKSKMSKTSLNYYIDQLTLPTQLNLLWNALCARKSSAMNKVSRDIKEQVFVTSWVTKTESIQLVSYVTKDLEEKIAWLFIRQKFMVFST